MALSSRLKTVRVMVVAGVMVMAGASGAFALPVELTRTEFAAQTAGLPTVVETLEGFTAQAVYPSPLVLANGTYTASAPTVSVVVCGGPNKCLASQDPDPRGFSLFPAGTTFWGTDFHFVLDQSLYGFDVTVVGGSGTTVFSHTTVDGFWGFTDPLGLMSITFARAAGVPTGNFSFDNVTTAVGPTAAVPEPATLALLATGLAGMTWRRRKAAR